MYRSQVQNGSYYAGGGALFPDIAWTNQRTLVEPAPTLRGLACPKRERNPSWNTLNLTDRYSSLNHAGEYMAENPKHLNALYFVGRKLTR